MKPINEFRIISSAQDALSQFQGSNYPLKNVAKDVINARKLNSNERKLFLDLIFAWARQSYLINDFCKKEQAYYQSMSKQQKDHLALLILAKKVLGFALDEQITNYAKQFDKYLGTLADKRYLIALGEVVASELLKSFGDSAYNIAKGLQESPKKYIAFDRSKLNRDEVIASLKALGHNPIPHPLVPMALELSHDLDFSKLSPLLAENIWLMDAGSQVIGEALQAKPSDKVLDMCCGVGGKTRYLAMNDCDLWAMDIDPRRIKIAKERLRNKKVSFVCADALNAPFENESFDRILLDAPCSGIGVLRRNPDLIYRLHSINHYCDLQKELLQKAVKLLRPGGLLIYATCSLFQSENKLAIDLISEKNKNLSILNNREIFLNAEVKLKDNELNKKCLELIPHIHDCDGFFIAGLLKK